MKSSFSSESISRMSDAFVTRESHQSSIYEEEEDIEAREHDTIFLSFPMPLSCDVCKKRFGFSKNAVQCRGCNYRFHQECSIHKPCLPKIIFPKTTTANFSSLAAYCPPNHPFVPPLLYHCVFALEHYFITTEGLYRLQGVSSAVKKLYNDFMKESNRLPPELSNVDPANITGCVKLFLMNLNGFLIPSTSYEDFLYAISSKSEQEIITTVFELPPPNRDTLAYLLLHLQKVAQHSNLNKMTLENLAPMLAPTIVGHPDTENRNDINEELGIASNKITILTYLLKLSPRIWKGFMQDDMSHVYLSKFNSSPSPFAKKRFCYNGIPPTNDPPPTAHAAGFSTPGNFVRKSFNVFSSAVRGFGYNSSY